MMSGTPQVAPVNFHYSYAGENLEVRCFLVRMNDSLVLIDAGVANSGETATADTVGNFDRPLTELGAAWSDISDIIITHAHPDHYGMLAEISAKVPAAAIWAGAADVETIESETHLKGHVRSLHDGDQVSKLRVISTPGHTMGHVCLMLEEASILFIGDLVDTLDRGHLSRPPKSATAAPALAEESLYKIANLDVSKVLFSHGDEIENPILAVRNLLRGAN